MLADVTFELGAKVFQRGFERVRRARGQGAEGVPGSPHFGLRRQLLDIAWLPWPSSMDCKMRSAHPSPLQQGVQNPQDSRAKKRIKFPVMPTGQVWSSSTIMVPVPMRLPAFGIEVKSMGVSSCSSTMKGVETPPGSKPRNFTPSRIPPACSSRISRAVVPMGSSHRPGRFTFPLAPYSLVPASLVRPKPRNHAAPLLTMWGTQLQCFHVIDHRRLAEQANHRWKWRLRSAGWLACLPARSAARSLPRKYNGHR